MLSKCLRKACFMFLRPAPVASSLESYSATSDGILLSKRIFRTFPGLEAKRTLKVSDASDDVPQSEIGDESLGGEIDLRREGREREAAELNVKRRMSGHRTMYGKAMKETEIDDELSVLEYYVRKAQESTDASGLDDAIEYDVVEADKKLFFKMVDLWIQDSGEARRGHREFIQVVLNNVERFNVQHDPNAYLKILECYPKSKHTGIQRNNWFNAVWQDKILDHEIGGRLVSTMRKYKVVPNDQFYDICTNLFGVFSRATAGMRSLLFWYPRLTNFVAFPISRQDLEDMTAAEVAVHALRKANPSLDASFEVFTVDSLEDDIANSDTKLNCLISVQTRDQKDLLKLHDSKLPVFVEGPNLMYLENRCVQYYTLRGDPVEKTSSHTPSKLLTDKEWWEKFYRRDFQSSREFSKDNKLYSNESFLPSVHMDEDTSRTKAVHERNQIKEVSSDVGSVEGPVYAIAATDLKSVEALRSWVYGLEQTNPILSKVTVLFNEKKSFLTDGNHAKRKK